PKNGASSNGAASWRLALWQFYQLCERARAVACIFRWFYCRNTRGTPLQRATELPRVRTQTQGLSSTVATITRELQAGARTFLTAQLLPAVAAEKSSDLMDLHFGEDHLFAVSLTTEARHLPSESLEMLPMKEIRDFILAYETARDQAERGKRKAWQTSLESVVEKVEKVSS
ncbi:unnamed protein product, partial [Amoebophrya sp. A25]